MKVKKLLAIFLIAFVTVFTLTACNTVGNGGQNGNGRNDDSSGDGGSSQGRIVSPISDGGSYDFG